MQPARLRIVPEIPLLPGGKIDERALVRLDALPVESAPAPPAAAPPGTTEVSEHARTAIAAAWREVLGTSPRADVRFRDAAGDSLRLLEVVLSLEQRLGRRLPLEVFSAETTAHEMARALDVALSASGHDSAPRNVYLLPGARGDTPGLAGLRSDCLPVAAMRIVGYPHWREMLDKGLTLDHIAQATVETIRGDAATGPICLVGYSFGVYVAYAACRLLEADGRDVASLVLIDMPRPRRPQVDTRLEGRIDVLRPLSRAARGAWWSVDRLARAARQGMAAERIGMIAATPGAAVVRAPIVRTIAASRVTKGWSRLFGAPGYWTSHHMAQEFRLRSIKEWAYRWSEPPSRIRTSVLLIRTGDDHGESAEDLGWRELCERVEVERVPGTHMTMLSAEHRPAVSRTIRATIARALTEPR
jgi:thioesterase domain-containing protein/acyl carrier protein